MSYWGIWMARTRSTSVDNSQLFMPRNGSKLQWWLMVSPCYEKGGVQGSNINVVGMG